MAKLPAKNVSNSDIINHKTNNLNLWRFANKTCAKLEKMTHKQIPTQLINNGYQNRSIKF